MNSHKIVPCMPENNGGIENAGACDQGRSAALGLKKEKAR
jgi:hypothetical protein